MRKQMIFQYYNELLESLADLHQMKQVVSRAFIREFETLDTHTNSDESEKIITWDSFGFDNPFTGKFEKLAHRTATLDDLRLLTCWHKNSQYCWLLVMAYEKFEIFLKMAYKEDTDKNPRDLNPMLCHFSEKFSRIGCNSANNTFEINLRVAVHLVEKMRHAIAHDQGFIDDLGKFTSKVIDDAGINNNKKVHEEFISQFVFEKRVFILEVPTDRHPNLLTYSDQYRYLVSCLISFAYLIQDAAD